MSLYTWLSSEGRSPLEIDRFDCSTPMRATPQTIVNYNYNVVSNYNTDEIRDYIQTMISEKTQNYSDQIYEMVVQRLNDSFDTDVRQIIDDVFKEISLEQIDEFFAREGD